MTFETLAGDELSSVILHVPHSSRFIPSDVRAGILLSDEELHAELDAMTDADTNRVGAAAAALSAVRPWTFVNRASRLVVDPERFPDEREEMNAVGMGAVYERTSQGAPLRLLTHAQRDHLVDTYFTPYAAAFAALVRERLAACGRVTIIDVHSFPPVALPYELHQDGQRPEVCIGTDAFHTPALLIQTAMLAMLRVAPTGNVALDSPFAGCYVPLEQYQRNAEVHAVMLELRRDVVAARLDELGAAVAALIDRIEPPVS